MVKEKFRPKRIFKNKKGYYFKVDGKKKYINLGDKKIKDKQLININIKNILGYVKRKKGYKRKVKRDLTKLKPGISLDKVKTDISAIGETKEHIPTQKTAKGYSLADLTDLIFSKRVIPELSIEGTIKREDKQKFKEEYEKKLEKLTDELSATNSIKKIFMKNLGSITTEDLKKIKQEVEKRDVPSMVGDDKNEDILSTLPEIPEDDGKPGDFLKGISKQSNLTTNVINSLLGDSSFTLKRGEHKQKVGNYTDKDFKELGDILLKYETFNKPLVAEYMKISKQDYISSGDLAKLKRILVDIYNKKIGKGFEAGNTGLWNTEIDEIFKDKLPDEYIPVISNDEMPKLRKYINRDIEKFGFIINKDNSDSQGSHWKAVFISRPEASVEIYDSLVSIPTDQFMKDLFKLVDAFDDNIMYKVKVNMVRDQSEKTENCGYFAVNFLINRFKGKKFKNATLYDKIEKSGEGEKEIKKFKTFL